MPLVVFFYYYHFVSVCTSTCYVDIGITTNYTAFAVSQLLLLGVLSYMFVLYRVYSMACM